MRVSGSGLGCAEWPRCEPGSFTPTETVLEDLHAAIEFGNRLLTFVVLGAALWFLWEVRRSSGLRRPALGRGKCASGTRRTAEHNPAMSPAGHEPR